MNDSPRSGKPPPAGALPGRSDGRPQPPTRHPSRTPKPVESDSVRSDSPGPSKPVNPASSEETEAVGSPRIDEDAAPRGTGTPGFVVCGCQREGCGAVFDGAPGSSVCPACAARSPATAGPWTHAPDPDGGTRCGKGSEGRDVLARAGEATCPDCRSAIETGQAPQPDTSESGPNPEDLDQARAMMDARGLSPDVLPPQPVPAETRPDSLLPVVQSVSEPPEREAGRLAFGGLIEGRADPGGQLPLLPAPEGPRVPLLELADVRGGPIMSRGRGAPLDLRLFVGACLWTPHHARATRGRLAVTVRELRDFLYPHGWTRARHWPAIQEALLRARDYMIPGVFQSERGNVHGWLPFRLAGGIGDGAGLDDVVLIDVELPPGSAHGPVIDRRDLAGLGVDSAPRFRAYIAAHSVAWFPGKTRIPHPKNRRLKLWSGDPGKYPILTAEDRRRLAFGEGDKSHRTRAEQEAPWTDLPGVELVTRTATTQDGKRGWLIVPRDAARRIKGDG